MKASLLSLVVAVFASTVLATDQPQAPANPGFEKLKSLAGEWKGKMKDSGDVKLTYKLVASGTALGELMEEPNMTMVTMYHLDGDRLMLTHYCAVGNQPRMRAAAFKDGDPTLKFAFFDATSMPDKKASHMHNVAFTFHDADHFTQEWTFYKDGKEGQKAVMEMERVK